MNPRDNDHVRLHGIDGFVADDLFGAFAEAEAISGATKCDKYLFSLSLNPPPSESVSVDQFEAAIAQVEKRLGLEGQPRAVVFHEKDGRRHAHAVWSKIDVGQMKAINLSHYKRKLMGLSREIFLEHGWDLPDGFRKHEDRDPLNTSRFESQQAKRLKRDRAATKAMFRACWEGSDSGAAFAAALKEQGFVLARGDRRGFVAVDANGKVWSLSRWCGVKAREMRRRLGPEAELPSVEEARARAQDLPRPEKLQPNPQHALKREEMIARQRAAREDLLRTQDTRRALETQAQMPKGMRSVFLRVTGQWPKTVAAAELAAKIAEQRDRQEQQTLIDAHLAERRALDQAIGPQYRKPKAPLVEEPVRASLSKRQIEQRPDLILAEISKTKATFKRTDVLRELAKHIDDPKELTGLADRALTSAEAVRLSSDRVPHYTTRNFQNAEQSLARLSAQMASSRGHGVASEHVSAAMKATNSKMKRAFDGTLSDEQQTALRHVLSDRQMASVVGLAGAGKSTMLEAAADAWQRQGIKVHGAALAGKAADGLQSSSDIQSRTLASLEMSWENGNAPINKDDVLIIDEAGMIGTRQMARITEKINEIGAKLVLVGDPDQLQPIEAGTPFRDVVATHGAAELKEIYRQTQDWQKVASRELAAGNIHEAIERYDRHGCVSRTQVRDDAIDALVESYVMDAAAKPDQSRLAFAHRRKDVHALNQSIRSALRGSDAPPEVTLQTATGPRDFAAGDRMVFGQNNKDLGVKNGMLGSVFSASENEVTIALDGDEKRHVTFNPTKYTKFDHGYAVTIHKSQGATVDQAYVLGSRSMDRHLAYVAMTRHRENLRVFVSRQDQPRWGHKQHHTREQTRRPDHSGPSMG
ncbi:AAA family ATPase [Gymnodinialimonas sp.]